MLESEAVTTETSVDPKELKELIARLSSPSGNTPDGSVRIKDIAETLEVKEDDVIRQLTLLRTKKQDELKAQQARNEIQSTSDLGTRNIPQQRMILAVIFFALFVSFMMFAFFLLRPASNPGAPSPVQAETITTPIIAPKAP
jgi:hypothetical protein